MAAIFSQRLSNGKRANSINCLQKMSSNQLEVLDEGRAFEIVYRSESSSLRSKSSLGVSSNSQDAAAHLSTKRASSATVRSLEVLPPDSNTAAKYVAFVSPQKESQHLSTDLSALGDASMTVNSSLEEQPEDIDVEEDRNICIERLMEEIQQMHQTVQELMNGKDLTGTEKTTEVGIVEEKISQSSASLSESTSGVSSVSSTDRPNLRESAKDDSGSTNQQKNSFEDVRALSSADQEKMKKAISKMKKLDEKLASITKREQEVKHQRKLLEQRIAMLEDGANKLYSIQYDGMQCKDDSLLEQRGLPSASVSPVFPTELKQPSGHSAVSEGVSPTARIAGDTPQDKKLPKEGFLEESVDSSQRQERTHLKHKEQNFILRNIELVSDSNVAMTDGEKRRLEELLAEDSDEQDHITEDISDVALFNPVVFGYDHGSLQKIRDIDSRLAEYSHSELRISDEVDINMVGDVQSPSPSMHVDGDEDEGHAKGDELIDQLRMERSETQRLKEINAKLQLLQTHRDFEEEPLSEPVHPLSPDILKELVEQGRQELNLVETESDTFNDL